MEQIEDKVLWLSLYADDTQILGSNTSDWLYLKIL